LRAAWWRSIVSISISGLASSCRAGFPSGCGKSTRLLRMRAVADEHQRGSGEGPWNRVIVLQEATLNCVGDGRTGKAFDFPQPEGPSSDTSSPARISRSRRRAPHAARKGLADAAQRDYGAPKSMLVGSSVGDERPPQNDAIIFPAGRWPDLRFTNRQRIGLGDIDRWPDHAGAQHFFVEAGPCAQRSCTDAERRRIAGIDDAILLQLADGIAQKFIGHFRIVAF